MTTRDTPDPSPSPADVPASPPWSPRGRAAHVWRRLENPLADKVRAWALDHSVTTTLWVCRGADGLTLAYAGPRDGLTHLTAFLRQRAESLPGSAGPATTRVSRVERSRMLQECARLGADLVFVGGSPATVARLPRHRSFILPFRVHQVVSTADGTGWRDRVSASERRQHRRNALRHGYRLEVSRDDADFAYFYDRMHEPTMRERHGPSARSMDRDTAYHSLFRPGGLLFFVRDGTRRVAGALAAMDRDGRRLTGRLIGVLDGEDQHRRRGALAAVYHLQLQWAAATGVTAVDLSGSEPFLSKGTWQFKRKLGAAVVLPPDRYGGLRLWLHIARDTPAVRDFLHRNPVLAVDGPEAFEALYFHDESRAPVTSSLAAACPGLTGVRLVDLSGLWPAEDLPETT
ncbi:GNAT family N-acetyltransferase [Streptomyces lavendulae]|uniref:GNAT family N-acetyltransferase n=1 Tax=Streptomyces lavendulae TaxID=1914 RepID=UPI003813AC07